MPRKKSAPSPASPSLPEAVNSTKNAAQKVSRHGENVPLYQDWQWHLGLFTEEEKAALRDWFAPSDRPYGEGNDAENFLNLISSSLSLSDQEKQRVLRALSDDTLSAFQVTELEKTFADEQQEFQKLVPTEGVIIVGLFAKAIIQWLHVLLPAPLARAKLQQLVHSKATNPSIIPAVFHEHRRHVAAAWALLGFASGVSRDYFENIQDEETALRILDTVVRYETPRTTRAAATYRREVEETIFQQTSANHQLQARWFVRRRAWHFFFEGNGVEALHGLDELLDSPKDAEDKKRSISTYLELCSYCGDVNHLARKAWLHDMSREDLLSNHSVQAPFEAAGEGKISGRILYEVFLRRKNEVETLENKTDLIHTASDLVLEIARQGEPFARNCELPDEVTTISLRNEAIIAAMGAYGHLLGEKSFLERACLPMESSKSARKDFLLLLIRWAIFKALMPMTDAVEVLNTYLPVKGDWEEKVSEFRSKCWDMLESFGESDFLFDCARAIEGNEKRGKRLARSITSVLEYQNTLLYLYSCLATENRELRKSIASTLQYLLGASRNSPTPARLKKLPGPDLSEKLRKKISMRSIFETSNVVGTEGERENWLGALPISTIPALVQKAAKKRGGATTRKKETTETDSPSPRSRVTRRKKVE